MDEYLDLHPRHTRSGAVGTTELWYIRRPSLVGVVHSTVLLDSRAPLLVYRFASRSILVQFQD